MASNNSAALKTTFVLPAILAGISAAMASAFAKLFSDTRTSSFAKFLTDLFPPTISSKSNPDLSAEDLPTWCLTLAVLRRKLTTMNQELVVLCCISPVDPQITLVVRILCFALIFVANASMWSLFTRALNTSRNSVPVVIVNSATNFVMTAILGKIIFGEPLSLTWYLGASLIVAGTVISSHPHNPATFVHEKKD